MAIAKIIGLAPRVPGTPDTSHFEARLDDPVLLAPNDFLRNTPFGITDVNQPTEQQIRRGNVGLFATLIHLRATAIAQAIVGGRDHSGFTVMRTGMEGEFEAVEPSHPWAQLLRRPNGNRSPLDIWRWASTIRDLLGSADFVVDHDRRGVPIAMYEIYPVFGRIRAQADGTGGVSGYVFQKAAGGTKDLDARDVVRLRHPDPVSPYEDMSLLQRAAFEIDKTLYGDIYGRDLIKNGLFPPAYLGTDADLTQQQAKRYGDEFRSKYLSSARKVKGIPVLGSGMEIRKTPFTPADLALIESQQLTDQHMFWVTGVPQGLVDHTANRANAQAAATHFANTVQTEADGIASQLTFGFERTFEADAGALVIHAPDVTPVDAMQRAKIDEIELRTGVSTINEIRTRDGMDEIDGGDVARISAGLVPVSSSEEDTDDDEPAPDEDEEVNRARGADAPDEQELTRLWRAVDDAKQEAEAPVEDAARSLLQDTFDAVVMGIEQMDEARALESILSVGAVFDLGEWVSAWRERLAGPVSSAMGDGFASGAGAVGLDATLPSGNMVIRQVVAAISESNGGIARTLQGEIADEIAKGIDAGQSIDEIANRIRDLGDGMAQWKPRQIAKTAGTAAFEVGRLVSFSEAGITLHRWLSQRDGRVRERHRLVDGDETIVGRPFENGLRFPSDPLGRPEQIVNCRCTTLPIIKSDEP